MLFFFFATVLSLVPLPSKYSGVYFNKTNGVILFEIYVDPLCPDCLDIWPTIHKLMMIYPTQLQFVAHLLPLPYHTYSLEMSQLILAIDTIDNLKAQKIFDYLYLKGDQDKFENDKLYNTTKADVIELMLNYASSTFDIDYDTLKEQYNNCASLARSAFSFAGAKGVSGTPTIYLNGVETELDPDSPFSDFTQEIDSLFT